MNEEKAREATAEEIDKVIHPEGAVTIVHVGGKGVSVTLLTRRWQKMFDAAALPMFQSEMGGPEAVLKSVADGSWPYTNLTAEILKAVVDADRHLDRAAAIVLASRVPGAKDDPEAEVLRQQEWLQENARTEEMLALVDAQVEKEKLLARVGERSPARFVRLLHLAGLTEITNESVKQLLTSLQQKLQAIPTGAGA